MSVIAIESLSRRFGDKHALREVDLSLPRGAVLGLVGQNGAGKTTLIRHILGMLRARSGSVQVFDLDPVVHPAEVLGRLGYLAEDRSLPAWMRVGELLRYARSFHPRWDASLAASLCREFQLDLEQKVRALSRGQHVRAALVLALAHRPELLVLDEPSSGLDPVVRKDVLEAILRTVAGEGRTVLFSSHLLDEVERMSDRLALIDRGRILLDGSLEAIRAHHHHVVVRAARSRDWLCRAFAGDPSHSSSTPILLRSSQHHGEHALLCNGDEETLLTSLRAAGAKILSHAPARLDEIFLAHTADPSDDDLLSHKTEGDDTGNRRRQLRRVERRL